MPRVSKEQIHAANQMTAIEFLRRYRPGSLVKSSARGEYQLAEHDSFKINGESSVWHWKSRDIGGKSALKYLIYVEGVPFVEAVQLLCEESPMYIPVQHEAVERERPLFRLPNPALNNDRVTRYLLGRGISLPTIRYCIERKILYESAEYHNCVFLGKDPQGVPKYAALRGIYDYGKETKEMLDDLTTRDQRMMFGLVTLVHLADSKEQLDSDTETLYSTARKHLCQLSTLRWQQKDGLDTVLPYGLRKIQALRTLTTESTAVLIPFRAQEIMQPNGLYYGQNAVSKNMIVADRRLLLNGNSFRLGVSGSGKSMSAKEEIVQIALSTEDDILILDPESEFGYLTEALGGEVIRISATSDTHINALDMDRAYGDERNPIVSKSEFVLSLFEQLIGDGMVTAKEKSILGRCTEQVYLPYIRNGYKGTPPTLQDFYRLLQMQPEPEAQGLALSSELFITGTLNTFAQHTNVDTQARIIAYDIRELGEQLMPLGMLVTLDAIYNRVIQNWKKGRRTWIFCDEFYILFRYEYSANFFYKLWKRIRKYNGLVTGLTQNVDELLRSDTARLMLANSEFLVMLNQSATDREELAKLLNISDNQLGYVTNVPAGCGLIRCAGNIVPFTNSFPKNTKLYGLMTTKPDEVRKE